MYTPEAWTLILADQNRCLNVNLQENLNLWIHTNVELGKLSNKPHVKTSKAQFIHCI